MYESPLAGQAILSSPAMDSEGVLYYGTAPPLTKDGKPATGKGTWIGLPWKQHEDNPIIAYNNTIQTA